MKKNLLLGIAMMGSLAFWSCTKNVQGGGASQEEAQIIKIQVDNGGDGLTTRAGRPLYSSEANQTIDKVKLFICLNDTKEIKFIKDFENWNTDGVSTGYTESGHGRFAEITLQGDDKLDKSTNYTVYAIGYHSESEYTDLSKITGLNVGGTFSENTVLTYGVGKDNNAEEIFAGSADFNVDENGKAAATVVLNRQVAGAYVYLTDIPYYADAEEFELVASTRYDQLVLGNFANKDIAVNGGGTTSPVINGWYTGGSKPEETVLVTIPLSKWFNNIEDTDGDGLIDWDNGNWKNPYSDDVPRPGFQKGSVFGSSFIIPFQKIEGHQTLKLVLKNTTGSVIAYWNINLQATGNNYNAMSVWNGVTFDNVAAEGLNKHYYSIVRNHLYTVGTRNSDQPVGPGPDPDPDPDKPGTPDPDDKPESLKNTQELVLKVNDNWDAIHEMELE